MLSPDEQTMLWAEAYNAALTGLLARKTDEFTQFSANDVYVLANQCKAFADKAISDALEFYKAGISSSGAQWAKKAKTH